MPKHTQRAIKLKHFREESRLKAVWRDGGMCAICHFIHFRDRAFQAVHHVYGRSQDCNNFREDYKNLLCVCHECHPLPIQFPGANRDLKWVEGVLYQANRGPINMDFKHDEE